MRRWGGHVFDMSQKGTFFPCPADTIAVVVRAEGNTPFLRPTKHVAITTSRQRQRIVGIGDAQSPTGTAPTLRRRGKRPFLRPAKHVAVTAFRWRQPIMGAGGAPCPTGITLKFEAKRGLFPAGGNKQKGYFPCLWYQPSNLTPPGRSFRNPPPAALRTSAGPPPSSAGG